MPSEQTMPEIAVRVTVPGAAEWLALSDDLLSGLVHALNNRVTALSVCAELAGLGDQRLLGEGVLLGEVLRLQHATALVGLLPARGHTEPLDIGPVLDDAIEMHAHHPRMRTVECAVERVGAVQPVRVPRWALLRLLLLLVDAAKESALEGRYGTVTLNLSSDDDWVRVRAPARAGEGHYAAEMATRCGGVLARDGEDLVLTLPSLLALRRHERTARPPA
ncbi:MAG TPA: hypothetical protein VM033_00400 [Gemmatimonadaceae bacterium]|nr:hypothetical protein [Gemmatimonadaceae bacterium]